MKKFLLSAFAMLLAVTAGAQNFAVANFHGRLNANKAVVVNNGSHKAPQKAALASNQRLAGNYTTDDCDAYTGISNYTTGSIRPATLLEEDVLAPYEGAKVVGMRFNLGQGETSDGVFIKQVKSDGYVYDLIDVDKTSTSPAGAANTGSWQTVMFDADNQFVLDSEHLSLLVGYNCTQTSKNAPIGLNTEATGSLLIYANIPTSAGGKGEAWYNFGSDATLAMQLILESDDFADNAAVPFDFGTFKVALGKTRNIAVSVANTGTKFNSIDYTVTLEGKTSAEKHVDFEGNNGMGGTFQVVVPFEGASAVGEYPVTFTITKVNGVENGSKVKTATGTNVTLAKEFAKRVVVEENTGTACGWCPRGHVAMHNMNEAYGDKFIGIAWHYYASSDPMYLSGYAVPGLRHGNAPQAVVDRSTDALDPYSEAQTTVAGLVDDLSTAEVTVSAMFNEDNTEVKAKANVETLVAGNYEVVFAVTADGLTGTTNAWKQANYLSSVYSGQNGYTAKSQMPSDLQHLWDEGKTYFQTFNDVLISSSYKSGVNLTKQFDLAENGTAQSSYTLTMPTKTAIKNAIDLDKVYIVAMLLDKNGVVVNAGKAKVAAYDPTGVENVKNNAEATVVARYTVDGVRVSAPVKGLNIVKMSDGTTRKVMVK